jgi:deoxyribose-phosphate aldolase
MDKKLCEFNHLIDYTNLDYNATDNQIVELCEKAKKLKVKSVCIRPDKVKLAAENLKKSDVLVCTVISFPKLKFGLDSGNLSTEEKLKETEKAIKDGADEIDVVFNWQLLKNERFKEENLDYLLNEITELSNLCHNNIDKDGESIVIKVIIESGELSNGLVDIATEICIKSGVDFIKTSTGMTNVGAEVSKVKLMKNTIFNRKSNMQIKASGGINKNNIEDFYPYVNRFGMGFKSVDELNGILVKEVDNY